MEPLFCKHTGAYLAQTADFCTRVFTPQPPLTLVAAPRPEALDMVAWRPCCPDTTRVRLHPEVQIRRSVRSLMHRDKARVILLMNRHVGTCVELDAWPDVCVTAWHAWDVVRPSMSNAHGATNVAALVIALIRHRLLMSDRDEVLHDAVPSRTFQWEVWCTRAAEPGRVLVRNGFSGRVFALDAQCPLLDVHGSFILPSGAEALDPLAASLCRAGMLRRLRASPEQFL